MKKKIIITSAVGLLIGLILFLPFPTGTYDDGGTKEYRALTYKIVVWNRYISKDVDINRITGTSISKYHNTSVYWFPDNFKSIDELWETQKDIAQKQPGETDYNDLDTLREKYPEYFNLSGFKGLEVYVWRMAEDSYQCGLLPGTNRNKAPEEIWDLRPLSIEQMKIILSTYDIPDENIFIFTYSNPLSSYIGTSDDNYLQKLSELFDYKYMVSKFDSRFSE